MVRQPAGTIIPSSQEFSKLRLWNSKRQGYCLDANQTGSDLSKTCLRMSLEIFVNLGPSRGIE